MHETRALLEHLSALEVELHHPGVRCSRERLQEILHPEFREVGRSGRAYTRQDVIDHLATSHSHPQVQSSNFALMSLGEGFALLTYRSVQLAPDASSTNQTYRSSIWERGVQGWQLRYHQGTPAAESW